MSQQAQMETRNIALNSPLFMRLFVPFAMAFFMSVLFRTVNSLLAPAFIAEFSMTASQLGVMSSTYFITFAFAQYPLGICLDRYGARRTLAFMLLFAVLGAFFFARAQSITWLMIGRGCIGIGVSGCLMAAIQAYREWVDPSKIPTVNSLQTFVGGIGGLVATKPVSYLLNFTDWRGVFVILTVLTLLNALLIYFFVPRRSQEGHKGEPLAQQLTATFRIASTGKFWRLAPAAVLVQASYLALNSLWIGPWFKDVAGFVPAAVPSWLFYCALAIALGYLANGIVADKLRAFGYRTSTVCIAGMSVYTIILGVLTFGSASASWFWILLVFFGPFSLLSYPIFSFMFDSSLSGRVTTLYNLLVFLITFVIQSGMGMIIDLFPPLAQGGYNPAGYAVALGILFALHLASIIWIFVFRRAEQDFQY